MSELTRDEIIESALDCHKRTNCFSCKINIAKEVCYGMSMTSRLSDAVRSLRDDYNAEVKKNKRLTEENERLIRALKIELCKNGGNTFDTL